MYLGAGGRPPETWISSVPAPVTLAPRACKKPCKSTISGSLAALQMRVSPAAPQAASMAFSVAPTLGKGSDKRRPASLGSRETQVLPPRLHLGTQGLKGADVQVDGRRPRAQPPGQQAEASPCRPARPPERGRRPASCP